MKVVRCKVCGEEHRCSRKSPSEAARERWAQGRKNTVGSTAVKRTERPVIHATAIVHRPALVVERSFEGRVEADKEAAMRRFIEQAERKGKH